MKESVTRVDVDGIGSLLIFYQIPWEGFRIKFQRMMTTPPEPLEAPINEMSKLSGD